MFCSAGGKYRSRSGPASALFLAFKPFGELGCGLRRRLGRGLGLRGFFLCLDRLGCRRNKSVGGFLGIGEKKVKVPLSHVHFTANKPPMMPANKSTLMAMPSYSYTTVSNPG